MYIGFWIKWKYTAAMGAIFRSKRKEGNIVNLLFIWNTRTLELACEWNNQMMAFISRKWCQWCNWSFQIHCRTSFEQCDSLDKHTIRMISGILHIEWNCPFSVSNRKSICSISIHKKKQTNMAISYRLVNVNAILIHSYKFHVIDIKDSIEILSNEVLLLCLWYFSFHCDVVSVFEIFSLAARFAKNSNEMLIFNGYSINDIFNGYSITLIDSLYICSETIFFLFDIWLRMHSFFGYVHCSRQFSILLTSVSVNFITKNYCRRGDT